SARVGDRVELEQGRAALHRRAGRAARRAQRVSRCDRLLPGGAGGTEFPRRRVGAGTRARTGRPREGPPRLSARLGLPPRRRRAGRDHRPQAAQGAGLSRRSGEARRLHRFRSARMSILVNRNTRLVCQGITGSAGSFHSRQMLAYGTNLIAGVTTGKGGTKFEEKVPVFDTLAQAVRETRANASVIFVPPPFAGDAILEAVAAGLPLVVCITEGIPINDMVRVK